MEEMMMAQPNTVVNRSDVLPATTHMGPVTLLVGDLDALTAYYRDAFLLEVLRQEGETVALGRRGVELLILQRDWSLPPNQPRDRKSTRLNSSHVAISYAVFCVEKK